MESAPRIEIHAETETQRGFEYDLSITDHSGLARRHRVTLAYVDHDALTGGLESPSALIERALRTACEHLDPSDLPDSFDLARLRRMSPELGAKLTGPGAPKQT